MFSCSHQFLSVKLGGGAKEGGDKAKGLMSLCIMLNLLCLTLAIQTVFGVELTIFTEEWVKILVAALIYFISYFGIGYSVRKVGDVSDLKANRISGVCSFFTGLWVLSSIFILVPFTLYLRAFY